LESDEIFGQRPLEKRFEFGQMSVFDLKPHSP